MLLHISDPHFGTERPEVVDALLRLAGQLQPERVILSGDITQRARAAQFAAAREFVDALPAPALVIPGNHDIPLFNLWARLVSPYAGFRCAFGPALECEWSTPQWLVIALNTTRWWRHKDGEVSGSQCRRVAQRLRQAAPGQVRVVVTHQPLLAIRENDVANLLHGHAQVAPAWTEAGADLLLGGHIHLPYVRPLRKAYPQLSRESHVVQAGTAVSRRVRGDVPNSVNVLRREGAADCVVERWDYDSAEGRFMLHGRHALPVSR
ncbi:metallophosphoesterase [Dyella sp.]|uniref:metallophosphoesterase family protein n=1 Tax=Dyella sp. TaxID=1869338 RepID=UPI002D76B587|nr:metallophosphoesterase [Dyella sp.]HET6432736.1 metallophosphoesterase [Dyella sp.]